MNASSSTAAGTTVPAVQAVPTARTAVTIRQLTMGIRRVESSSCRGTSSIFSEVICASFTVSLCPTRAFVARAKCDLPSTFQCFRRHLSARAHEQPLV